MNWTHPTQRRLVAMTCLRFYARQLRESGSLAAEAGS